MHFRHVWGLFSTNWSFFASAGFLSSSAGQSVVGYTEHNLKISRAELNSGFKRGQCPECKGTTKQVIEWKGASTRPPKGTDGEIRTFPDLPLAATRGAASGHPKFVLQDGRDPGGPFTYQRTGRSNVRQLWSTARKLAVDSTKPPPSSLLRSFRLQPSLGNGAVDDVSLNPLAVWAGVGSEVFAAHARLYRRQLHWRAAGDALGSLVLFVQHGVTRSGDHPIIARCITVRWSILTTIRSREQKNDATADLTCWDRL